MILRTFDAFAVPNSRSADHIRSQVGEDARILFLPNTVDEEFYSRRDDTERAEARARLGVAPRARLIVQVSSLIRRKGVRELAEAYLALGEAERRGSVLAFVGAGALESELRALADRVGEAGEIRLAGAQSLSGVRDWLMAADAFFLPAISDANPLAPIEASFAGLPIFLSRLAGNSPEVVREGVNGFCLPEIRAAALAEYLRRALTMPAAELATMGVAARANAERRFGRAKAAQSLVSALRSVGEGP
jgi:glycosyltransferase involved in cell wall biosynthesis